MITLLVQEEEEEEEEEEEKMQIISCYKLVEYVRGYS
jgi:hypothetical protein